MNLFRKAYCRSYQRILKFVKPVLPYRDPIILDHNEELGSLLRRNGIKRVLLLTDKTLKHLGLSEKVEKVLYKAGIKVNVFSDIKANPTIKNVEEAYKAYQNMKAEAIVALGGGSVIDCAKATGVKVVKPNSDLRKMRGVLKIHKKLPFIVAIPTTAGTGSEATLAAVLVDEDNNDKFAINDFVLQPNVAVLDAKNISSCPQLLRATTGMDALTHAVEAYIGNSLDSESRASAVEAMRIIFKNLEENYYINTPESGDQLLFASFLAGRAFSRSYVGNIHALAHAIGGFYDTPHGLANAVLMPNVLESYRPVVDEKLYECAVLTGLCDKNFPVEKAAELFIEKVRELNKNMGIPEYLEDIRNCDIPALAKHAEKEANPLYPVPVIFDETELEEILKKVTKQALIKEWNYK